MEKKNPYKYVSLLTRLKNPYGVEGLKPFFNNSKTYIEEASVAEHELKVKLLESFISTTTDEKEKYLANRMLVEEKTLLENAKHILWRRENLNI
jgi:hypothetical protein